MAINPDLLVSAAILQDYFVDNVTAEAMSNGVITLYQDNNRTTLKNWYYQSGSPGAYTYVALPNPLTLSGVGTITDANGNDTIPFFYPFRESDNLTPETYYITVVDSNGQGQFTRQNFPSHLGSGGGGGGGGTDIDNLIINNVFWRNVGSVNLQSILATTVSLSQHDGFTMPDLLFIKNTGGAADTLTFTKFGLGSTPLIGDITPEYYINHKCTSLQAGETQKVYQIPITLHVKTLESQKGTITIQAQNVGGNVNNFINIFVYQFLGTGVASPAPVLIQKLILNNSWQKFSIPVTLPSASGAVLGNGDDDALFLQIGIPTAVTCEVNFTLPSLFLSTTVPTNNFVDYDEINAIISSPRTGDTRTSINQFAPYGWVPMNDGTIGNPSSNSTSRANADTWPLYNLIWTLASPFDTGFPFNGIAQMFTSAGATANYGVSAIADFNANKALSLTKMFGKVVMGTVPISMLLPKDHAPIVASNSAGALLITVADISAFYPTVPVIFNSTGSLPGGIVGNAIYFASNIVGNTFNVYPNYNDAILLTSPILFTSTGSNSTITVQVTGTSIGEYFHRISIPELPIHNHGLFLQGGGAVRPIVNATAATTTSGEDQSVIDNTGGGNTHNTIQPSTFYNIFMKL